MLHGRSCIAGAKTGLAVPDHAGGQRFAYVRSRYNVAIYSVFLASFQSHLNSVVDLHAILCQ